MKKSTKEIQEKDQIINPFILMICAIVVVSFLHISFTNDLRSGGQNSNPFASVERFVIEHVALF